MRATHEVAARPRAPHPSRPKLAGVPDAPSRRRRVGFLAASFLLVSLLVVGVVVLQTLASQNAFRFEELSRQADRLRDQQRELTLQVAELQAPGRIKKAARELGLRLVPLEEMQTIVVRAPTRLDAEARP